MKLSAIWVVIVMLWAWTSAHAEPVDVTYSVAGSAGNWTYDFSVTNNLGGTNDLYFFGVALPATSISAAPAGFSYTNGSNPFSAVPYGGSNALYNNHWIVGSFAPPIGIAPGATLSGFDVVGTSAAPVTTVPWFTFAYGGTYTATPYLNTSSNPGFEGIASNLVTPVPEPSTDVMLLTGLGVLALAGSKGFKRCISRSSRGLARHNRAQAV